MKFAALGADQVQRGGGDPRQAARLKDGARQFEAMLLEQMLKPLQFGSAPGEEDAAGGGAGETVRGFGTEALAKAMASGGGFGLARQIERQVRAEGESRAHSEGGTKV